MKKIKETEIHKFLIKLLEEKGPVPKKEKKNVLNYRYLDSAHIDSFGILSFINNIENKFNIKLSDKDTNSDEFRASTNQDLMKKAWQSFCRHGMYGYANALSDNIIIEFPE